MSPRAVALVSGGLDSVTLAHLLDAQGWDLTMVWVDYGQRHLREREYAAVCARQLGAELRAFSIRDSHPLPGALTDHDTPVPLGHYADESMRSTVVPNRNALLLDLATATAVAVGAQMVATAVHSGDHPIYPDCRPEFVRAYEQMVLVANEGHLASGFRVHAPFVGMGKDGVVRLGDELGVPFSLTWSCYIGGEHHCGRCGTCVERREAFQLAGVTDPTAYAD